MAEQFRGLVPDAGHYVMHWAGVTGPREVFAESLGDVTHCFGVLVALALGFGLMALVFYSSRRGYDEADRDRS